MLAADKPPLDEVYLEHYGVKGMKWGQQKIHSFRNDPDSSGVSRKEARREIKIQNRQTGRNLRAFEGSDNRSAAIRKARADTDSATRKYQDLKADLKDQKSRGSIGRNKARIILNQAKNERYENTYKSEQRTAGEQFIEALFSPR